MNAPVTDEQRTGPRCDERCKGRLDVAVAADIENDELLPDRVRRGLHVASAAASVSECSDLPARQSSSPWAPARAAAPVASPPTRRRKAHTRDVAAGRLRLATRPRSTGSPPLAKTIGIVEVAALAASAEPMPADDHGHRPANQFGRQRRQPIDVDRPPSDIRSRRSGPRR